jgi:uncharacterized protein with beta-barrel porin domain
MPVLGYDADDAFITLRPITISQLLPAGAPKNVANIAAAIDHAILHDSGYNAFGPLATMSAGNLETTLSQMVGEIGVDTAQSVFGLNGAFLDALTDQSVSGVIDGRFAALSPPLTRVAFAGPADRTPLETASGIRVWTTSYGQWDHLGGDAGSFGTHTTDDRNYGVAAGAEYRIDSTAVIGTAVGAGWTSWSADGGNGAANGFQFTLYGSKNINDLYLSATAAYAGFAATTNRSFTLAGTNAYRAHFDPHSELIDLEAAERFAIDDDLWLAPFADLRGQFFQTPAYSEATVAGSSFYALSYAAKSQSDVSHDLGLELDQRWRPDDGQPVDFNAQIGWVHQYAGAISDQMSFSAFAGTAFTGYGTRGPKDAVRFAVGGTTDIASSLSLAIEAQTLLSGNSQSYGGNARLSYRW